MIAIFVFSIFKYCIGNKNKIKMVKQIILPSLRDATFKITVSLFLLSYIIK